MPPSPAMRCSPGQELRRDNHKRGRSLEGGILFREKDDDLALFNEVQTRERDNFLLQSNDDFDDTFSTKLRYFSDNKLGISSPAGGERSDLLNADGEKNDYDWLLTPPDTPLFPCLDDEKHVVTLEQRGRPRSQPITISRSSSIEKNHRSNRGSASPIRSSPSPMSGNNTFQTRGRPSSAPRSSPTPSLPHATTARKQSPSPSKPSTPASRSSTPTARRMSMGSGGAMSSSGVRGTSPVNSSRGNSTSPKISEWHSSIPGFSLDAPPNLRTSLADRPATYVRGSSPVSRNGRGETSSRSGRQSMSPTASRGVSSSNSHDRDQFSSQSKGSAASFGAEDVDSLQSVPVSCADHSASRRVGAFPSNRVPAFSKKLTLTGLSSSAPKRSFDSALRQMDYGKAPQNMFRPLLSSVPSSSFYPGKAELALISRNSSITTGSNTSSDQGTIGAHDTEDGDRNQDDMVSECGKAPYQDGQHDIFTFEKADSAYVDISLGTQDGSQDAQYGNFGRVASIDSPRSGSENFDYSSESLTITATSEALKGNYLEVNGVEDVALCFKCRRRYCAMDLAEGDLDLCPDCTMSDEPLTATIPMPTMFVSENFRSLSVEISEEISDENRSLNAMEPLVAVLESSETNMTEARVPQLGHTFCAEPNQDLSSEKSVVQKLAEEDVRGLANWQETSKNGAQPMPHSNDDLHLKQDASEGAGISIWLMRSSSGKGPVFKCRTFTASSIAWDDVSYVRYGASVRSSLGQSSASATSSLDWGSARQTETHPQRQLSGRNSDIGSYGYDISTKHQRTWSSLSGTSIHAFPSLRLATSTHEEKFEVFGAVAGNEVGGTNAFPQEQFLPTESTGVNDTCTEVGCSNDLCGTVLASTPELSTITLSIHSRDSSIASSLSIEDSTSIGNYEGIHNNAGIVSDREASALTKAPSTGEDGMVPKSIFDRVDVAEDPTQSLLDTLSQKEVENGYLGSPGSQSDNGSPHPRSTMGELPDPCNATASDKDIPASATEPDTSDHAYGIPVESTVTVESCGGTKARSLSLEEATETILFCSSVIHNLVSEAAAIAMEKEDSAPLEGSQPMVTILGNYNSDRNDLCDRTAGKRTFKSQNARHRRVKRDTNFPLVNTESDENVDISTTCIIGVPLKDDSMKPPKLESKCNCTVM